MVADNTPEPAANGQTSERAERCERCRFWHWYINERDPWGRRECRRNPPVIVDGQVEPNRVKGSDADEYTEALSRQWPITFSDDWCGEFKPVRTDVLNKSVCDFIRYPHNSVRHRIALAVERHLDLSRAAVVADLLECRAKDLFEQKNFGTVSLEIIRKHLSEHGLKLKGD